MIKMHNGAPASVDSYVIPLVISAVGIVFTILTLSSFFFIFWWHYLRSHQSPHSTTKNNSKGVPKEILSKIRIISYLSPQENKEYDDWVQNECSICLGQYEEEEELRVLPNCSHAFHVPCIDAWFEEHTNCPICRSPIDSECCESSSSTFLPTDSSESSVQEQRVFHVIPIDSDESTLESNEFEGVHPVLDRHSHSHSHSCCHHMKKKPRLLGTRLKRSLSLDQLSLYVAVNVQREQEQEQEQASASSSSSSISNSKWVMTMNRYKSKSLKHVLMRSFSQCTHFSDILPN